ncbi:MAG: exonuclease SbcCD subunit D [Dehalococcoidia bacterium]|nr:exonuclease SbcCD subunit D [Dehalococcoidia bacterium]
MRIIHFADLHIGVENYSRIDPATGLSTRLLDFLRAYDEMVDFAIRERVDLVLFCGDAYKSRDPSQTQQREFAKRIAKLSAAGIPVFLLTGNHDLPNAIGRATALEIFQTIPMDNVHVVSRVGTHIIQTPAGPLQVVSVPWLTQGRLLSVNEYKNTPADRVHQLLEERITASIRHEIEGLDRDLPTVLAGHLSLPQATASSEKGMAIGRDPVIQKSELDSPSLDYVALGHIHKMQKFEGLVPVVYSGSMQRVDFGEEKDEKGFYLIEIDPARPPEKRLLSYQFVPVWARPFVTVSVNVKSTDPTNEVLRAIERASISDAIVRLQVKLSRETYPYFDDAQISRALSSAHYLAGISKEVQDEARATRLGGVSVEGLTPLRALEMYLETKKTSKELTRELMEEAKKLIEMVEYQR